MATKIKYFKIKFSEYKLNWKTYPNQFSGHPGISSHQSRSLCCRWKSLPGSHQLVRSRTGTNYRSQFCLSADGNPGLLPDYQKVFKSGETLPDRCINWTAALIGAANFCRFRFWCTRRYARRFSHRYNTVSDAYCFIRNQRSDVYSPD